MSKGTKEGKVTSSSLKLTVRDTTILKFIGEQHTVCFDHLRRVLRQFDHPQSPETDLMSVGATRYAQERWSKLELIDQPRQVIPGRPFYRWLSRKGLKTLNLPYTYHAPTFVELAHIDAMNRVRLHLERYYNEGKWLGERSMLLEIAPEHRNMFRHRPELPDGELPYLKPCQLQQQNFFLT